MMLFFSLSLSARLYRRAWGVRNGVSRHCAFFFLWEKTSKNVFSFSNFIPLSLSLSLFAPRARSRAIYFSRPARIIVGDFDDERTKRKAKMMILLKAHPPDDAERRTTE